MGWFAQYDASKRTKDIVRRKQSHRHEVHFAIVQKSLNAYSLERAMRGLPWAVALRAGTAHLL